MPRNHDRCPATVHLGAQAGPAVRVKVGVTVDDQQTQPAQIVQDRTQQRELTQVELARPVGEYLGQDRSAFGQHMREGGIAATTAAALAPPVLG